jgi:hypothetical protein
MGFFVGAVCAASSIVQCSQTALLYIAIVTLDSALKNVIYC